MLKSLGAFTAYLKLVKSGKYAPATCQKIKRKHPSGEKWFHFRFNCLAAFIRSMIVLGILGKKRFQYWRLLFWAVLTRPRLLPQAVTLAIYGFHFRKVFEKSLIRGGYNN